MNPMITAKLDRFESIDLASLDRCARLRTRKDRKYVVSADTLAALLDELPSEVRILEIDGLRWFGYRSVYFDTDRLDSYRLAATHRPHRFKVRTRTYLDTDITMAEVKTKNRRGRTVKRRQSIDAGSGWVDDTIRTFAAEFSETEPYADSLEPVLTSDYQRATLAFPAAGVRVTIDAAYRCTDASGVTAGLDTEYIVETKTDGTPSIVDRLLWRAGHRPEKISKYATGLAALNPELPANRWNPVLRTHFGRTRPAQSRKTTPMTPKKKHSALSSAFLALGLMIAGCSDGGSTASPVGETDTEIAAAAASSDGDSTDGAEAGSGDQETTSETVEAAIAENQASHADSGDLDYAESEVVEIMLDGTLASVDSQAVTVDGATITITAEGTYKLTGTLTDGEVVVDVLDSEDVTLILDNANITNSDGAAIAVMNADEAVVVLADGSTNQLTDGATYTFPDAETDEPNAALFSAADLTIGGDGELVVTANFNDGIASKDGLVIESGAIIVTAVDDAIRGKDYVIVNGGTIVADAGGDGIKADNDEETERGYVQIAAGVIGITSGDDGVQAATDVLITGGAVTIDAGSASDAGRAIQGDAMVLVSGGSIDAGATDDAIHSNDQIAIDGGAITLAAGDDGIHGDYLVTIDGGSITITGAYEGIESEVIVINDGFIDITSSDDGLNVASAEEATVDTTAQPAGGRRGGGGPGGDEAVGEHYIYINGGTTVITITGDLAEQGDGIDANGHVEMTGGVVAVSGPTDTRNSAVDYSGGTFVMTGGTFIGTNIDGRNSEGIGTGSSQASLYLTTGSTISAGTVVHIETPDGDGLVTFEPANDYSVIVFSSPDLSDGESYDVYLGGSVTGASANDLYEDADYTPGELSGSATANL